MRLITFFLGLLFFASTLSAQNSVLIGATHEEVIRLYGQPVSQLKSPAREVLVYPTGRATLENEKVTMTTLPMLPGMENFQPASVIAAANQPTPQPQVTPHRTATPAPHSEPSIVPTPVAPSSGSGIGVALRWVLSGLLAAALFGFLGWRAWRKKYPPGPTAKDLPTDAGSMLVGTLKPMRTRAPVLTRPPMMTHRPDEPLVPGTRPPAPGSRATATSAKDLVLTQRLFNKLEWRRIEMLVSRYFALQGLQARRKKVSSEGTVDIDFFERGAEKPFARVRCKGWLSEKLGTRLIREFSEELTTEGIERGQLIATGEFTSDARELAEARGIDLVDGTEFVKRVNALTPNGRAGLLEMVLTGDYTTPTCVKCDVKMVLRVEGEKPAWGCRNLPLCRATLPLRAGSD